MNPDAYKDALARLGLSQAGAARLFRVHERTSSRWANGLQDIPKAVEIALKLMIRFHVKPASFL